MVTCQPVGDQATGISPLDPDQKEGVNAERPWPSCAPAFSIIYIKKFHTSQLNEKESIWFPQIFLVCTACTVPLRNIGMLQANNQKLL